MESSMVISLLVLVISLLFGSGSGNSNQSRTALPLTESSMVNSPLAEGGLC